MYLVRASKSCECLSVIHLFTEFNQLMPFVIRVVLNHISGVRQTIKDRSGNERKPAVATSWATQTGYHIPLVSCLYNCALKYIKMYILKKIIIINNII